MNIPEKILKYIDISSLESETIGRSDASVERFGEMYLKSDSISSSLPREHRALRYMQGKVSVPEIVEYVEEEGRAYLLTRRIPGTMACRKENLATPERTVKLLAEGLKILWNADISDCPEELIFTFSRVLELAEKRLSEAGLEEWEDSEFESPEALLRYLKTVDFKDDLVLAHGDYCLPNVFLEGDKVTGFLDMADAGVCDRYMDIAQCLWSIEYNFRTDKYNSLFLENLGIEPDYEKIRLWSLYGMLF
ncbi:MAG: aminoglycoside 3'-phosphotransferase [Clostridiales bacterium]|nr:aminoglycoside 3'-phosphotransferase [Clostridiales bacterium]